MICLTVYNVKLPYIMLKAPPPTIITTIQAPDIMKKTTVYSETCNVQIVI